MFIEWWDKISFTGSDGIAWLALTVSVLSAAFSFWYGRSQHLVNQGALADRKKAEEKAKEAKIEVVLTGNPRKYVLTFKNTGQHEATNIELDVTPGSVVADFLQFALRELPKSLAPMAGRNYLAIVTMDMAPPFVFEVSFNDGRAAQQKARITLDLP